VFKALFAPDLNNDGQKSILSPQAVEAGHVFLSPGPSDGASCMV
jgi:hypothetical protein